MRMTTTISTFYLAKVEIINFVLDTEMGVKLTDTSDPLHKAFYSRVDVL